MKRNTLNYWGGDEGIEDEASMQEPEPHTEQSF